MPNRYQTRDEGSTDVLYEDHGTLYLVHPMTQEAKDWVTTNIQHDAQWWCGALVVEPRFANNLWQGMENDGLLVRKKKV